MARKVFFSFHYERDSHRVSQIRECNSITDHFVRTPFLPKSEWESIERTGDSAVRKWIDNNMNGTSVIILCFGLETYTRRWVLYELDKAHKEGRGIVAINMSGMKTMQGQADLTGTNPLSKVFDESSSTALIHYNKYKTYHWINDDGRNNIDEWVEAAAKSVER